MTVEGSSLPGEKEAREHLAHVLQSPAFERSPRMQRFLRYLCEETFAGRSALLKEYSIALHVFDKPEDFDPGTSATIRVEAGRLRRLLKNYLADHGRSDAILLSIPKGGYVPVFARAGAAAERPDEPAPAIAEETRLLPGVEWGWVTVMSCAFGSPTVPEPTADFLAAYDIFRENFVSVMQRHGGTIDGGAAARLTVYFGWPGALEEAAGRAMTAATDLMACVRAEHGDIFHARVAIATGRVLSRICRDRPLILGQAPLLALKILDRTPPGAILLSEETRSRSRDAFETIAAGSIGEDEPGIPIWRLLAARPVTRFLAGRDAAPAGLIGRSEELQLLRSRWQLAAAGEGQAVILEGEAGIGKSRLSEAVIQRLQPKGIRIRLQCSPHHANSALYPVIQLLRGLLARGRPGTDATERFLTRFGLDQPGNRALLQALLLQEETEGMLASASERKEKTLQLFVDILAALCHSRPVILLVEDLHWADPTTLELIGYGAQAAEDLRLYLIMTGRLGCSTRLDTARPVTVHRLARMSRHDCSDVIDATLGHATLPDAARAAIIDKAEGVPLYLEELTKLLLAQNVQTPSLSDVPESLNDLLASQLGCLGFARRVAQVAAIVGRDFSSEMLKAVTGEEMSRVDAAVDQLLAAGILVRTRSAGEKRYCFRHALLRDAAYATIIDADRKELHYRVGGILVDCFPDVAADRPEIVAGHMRDGGHMGEAVPFWLDAGRKAARRYALAEAIADFRAALDGLAVLAPGPEINERELDVLLELGTTVREAEGYYTAGLKSIYERARALAAGLNRSDALAASIHGLWTVAAGCGQWRHADELAHEFGGFVRSLGQNARLEAEGGRMLGGSAAFRGDFPGAQAHFQRVLAVYDPASHRQSFGYDPGAASTAYLSWVHWHMGNAEEGRRNADRALETAEALGQPATMSLVLVWLLFHAVCESDHNRITFYNDRLQAVCSKQICRFWQPFGRACVEWASFHATRDPSHLDRLFQHTRAFSELYLTSCLHILAMDICNELGRYEEGLDHARMAEAFIAEHDERIWEAEYWRLLGLLHARWGEDRAKGTHCLERALTIARGQQAVMLERRAEAALQAMVSPPQECRPSPRVVPVPARG